MKILISFLFLLQLAFAQSPESISYQAIARDASGDIIKNKNLSFKISILRDSISGPTAYSEIHSVLSNQFGLVNFNIGEGQIDTGVFSSLDWGNKSYFLKVEFDPSGATSFQLMGISKFVSVPYSLYSKESGSVKHKGSTPETLIFLEH